MPTLQSSAVSNRISEASTKSPREALAIEVLHNLEHQHRWTDLKLFTVSSPTSASVTPKSSPSRAQARSRSPARNVIFLISGLPPRHTYIHPDLQKWLVKNDVNETEVPIRREWVLPLSLAEKWSLKQFSWVFDGLEQREVIRVSKCPGEGTVDFEWKDGKRVLLGMLAHNGMGGDGTISYYIMQEGEVKPRQNG